MSGVKNVITPYFRVSYPNVFKAKRNTLNGKDEFSVVALFEKGEDLSKLKAAAEEALRSKFGEKLPANWRSPFRDQGERAKENDEGKMVLPDGYEEGAIMLNLKSNQKPGLVNQRREDIIDESEFYGGCWARAEVRAYAYDQAGNRGVAFGLQNVQKVGDDDPFGNRTKPQDAFSAIEEDVAEGTQPKDANSLFG